MSTEALGLIGKRIGEYQITGRIGVGGMGVVYEGRQPLIGKRVAVKVLLPHLSKEQELVTRFLSEARAVNAIRHRGIVDIFGFGQLPDGSHYFVMEHLEGTPFDKLICERAPVPVSEALGWVEEVLDALAAAHAAGVVHRDIKPSNLFLVNTGRGKPYIKLLDFGIAKLGATQRGNTPETRASVILGTPDYISPEQARGRPSSPQTDLYAVGCVLFELVTGKRVFDGENPLNTMWHHVEDAPPVPSSLLATIPPRLDEVILWALEKDAARRPPSAQVMAEHLAAIRESLPMSRLTPAPLDDSAPVTAPPTSVRSRVSGEIPRPTPESASLAEETRLTPVGLVTTPATPRHEPSPSAKAPPRKSAKSAGAPSSDFDESMERRLAALRKAPRSWLLQVVVGVALVVGVTGVLLINGTSSPDEPVTPVVTEPERREPLSPEPPKPEPLRPEPEKPEPLSPEPRAPNAEACPTPGRGAEVGVEGTQAPHRRAAQGEAA